MYPPAEPSKTSYCDPLCDVLDGRLNSCRASLAVYMGPIALTIKGAMNGGGGSLSRDVGSSVGARSGASGGNNDIYGVVRSGCCDGSLEDMICDSPDVIFAATNLALQ